MTEPPDEGRTDRRTPARSAWNWLFWGSVFALVAVVAFGVGMVAERTLFAGGSLFDRSMFAGGAASDAGATLQQGFPHYAEVRDLLEEEYFFRPTDATASATFAAELDRKAQAGIAAVAATPNASMDDYRRQLDYAAARGMTTGLADPYTTFFEPVEQGALAERLEGQYEGIGIWVVQPEGKFQIVSPIPDSPAEQAGLRSGDLIVAADGRSLDGLAEEDALHLIRGPAGTSVRLSVVRDGAAFDVTVERQAIIIPAVTYERVADGAVAWIRVSIFGDRTTPELDAALERARDEGVRGIVLDLRGNGGGWVSSAREMIGRFVPADRGPALYEDESPVDDANVTEESIVGGGEEVFDLPLAVLVDGGSASASEIVAGALRDYGRATLVGSHTFGKGLVQRIHDFPDGSSARITTARWLTPNKAPIPEGGLVPDVIVEPPGTPGAPSATPVGTPAAATPVSSRATPAATPLASPVAGQAPADDAPLNRAIEIVLGGSGGA